MKKNKTAFISVCLSAIFSAVLIFGEDDRTSGGINNPDARIELAKASAFTQTRSEEINALCGTYWQAGKKNSCTSVKADGITVYSTFMSFNYSNIVWNKTSDSEWICTAYRRNNSSYKKGSEKVILTFSVGDDGSTVLSQYITAMGGKKSGPLKKERDVEACGNYFVYNKSDSSSPKLRLPKSL